MCLLFRSIFQLQLQANELVNFSKLNKGNLNILFLHLNTILYQNYLLFLDDQSVHLSNRSNLHQSNQDNTKKIRKLTLAKSLMYKVMVDLHKKVQLNQKI